MNKSTRRMLLLCTLIMSLLSVNRALKARTMSDNKHFLTKLPKMKDIMHRKPIEVDEGVCIDTLFQSKDYVCKDTEKIYQQDDGHVTENVFDRIYHLISYLLFPYIGFQIMVALNDQDSIDDEF